MKQMCYEIQVGKEENENNDDEDDCHMTFECRGNCDDFLLLSSTASCVLSFKQIQHIWTCMIHFFLLCFPTILKEKS